MKYIKITSCSKCPLKDYTDYKKDKWFCGPLSQADIKNLELSDIKDLSNILENCPLEDLNDQPQSKEPMPKETIEIKVLDFPEAQELIQGLNDKIETLESAIKGFIDDMWSPIPPTDKAALADDNVIKFEKLLEGA